MTDRDDLRAFALAALAAVGAALAGGWLGAPPTLAGPLAALVGVAVGARARARAGAAPGSDAAPRPPREATSPSPSLPTGGGRAVLEQLPLGLALVGADGRILFQNEAARELLERDVAGLHCSAAFRFPALLEAINRALSARESAEVDVSIMRASERVIHAHVRPLPGAIDADAPSALVLLEDRTRMAKAEALRRDFVANASHELKTPLASISGFIETLQGHARDDPEATDRFLAIMAQQAQRMKRLVEDLLSLNRIEINEHVQPREPLDLAAVAWEVAGALKPVADVEGAQIVVELPEEGLIVRGDRQEIAQVLVNLIDNAIKYAGQGGPIRIARATGEGARPGLVGVSVIDSGPGIAREHLPRLTERFYRVSPARSRERGGTGLGLAIAKHVLNRHRGELTISSVVGQGSRFTIWLPELSAPVRSPG